MSRAEVQRRVLPSVLAIALGLSCDAVLAQTSQQGASTDVPSVSQSPASDQRGADRLERLRNALIDQAMDAPVRVTSSAWLDESGQLRHVSRFFSEVRARAAADALFQASESENIRTTGSKAAPSSATAQSAVSATSDQVVEVKPPAQAPAVASRSGALPAGAAPAQPGAAQSLPPRAVTPAPSTVAHSAADGSAPEACRVGGADLARLAVLDSVIHPADGSRNHAVLQDLERYFHQVFSERSRAGALRVVGSEPLQVDSYNRLLTATGQLDAPYRIQLTIQSDRVDQRPVGLGAQPDQSPIRQVLWTSLQAVSDLARPPESRMPNRRIDVSATLVEQFSGKVLLRQGWTIIVPGAAPSIHSEVLPDAALAEARLSALTWWSEALERLRCQPVMVRANGSPLGSVTISVGGLAGVRVGDRWAVADPSKIPSRILEPGSLERALLAEVVSVGPYRSVLRLTSDPGNARALFSVERGASWFATPL